MDILIYGATEIGHMVATRLCQEHNVTLIDAVERLPEKFANLDIGFISGSGADVIALEQGNIEDLDLFIACSGLDEANIVACWTVKKIADLETICFVYSKELYGNLNSTDKYQSRYDIDVVIWPQYLLTQDIFRIISVPDAIDVEHFAEGQGKLFEYRIKENSSLINIKVMDCPFPPDVLIVGITRDNELFIPDGSTVILYDDKVIFIGTGAALDLLSATVFQQGNSIQTAVVIGGGNVGFLLATKLEQAGIRVKLIEQDKERCLFLADHLKKSLILHGNGTDLELLEGELIGQTDVAVTVTNNDEKNLLCSLLIKQLGCERIITRVENTRNINLFERVGVDVVVSPRESALTELLNRVQTHNVNILALVEGGQGELLQIAMPDDFVETRVMDIRFEVSGIIGIVRRGRRIIIPNGMTLIQPGDVLKIFTMAEDAEIIKQYFTQ
jgi:trk system potassium uptake protein TrkA